MLGIKNRIMGESLGIICQGLGLITKNLISQFTTHFNSFSDLLCCSALARTIAVRSVDLLSQRLQWGTTRHKHTSVNATFYVHVAMAMITPNYTLPIPRSRLNAKNAPSIHPSTIKNFSRIKWNIENLTPLHFVQPFFYFILSVTGFLAVSWQEIWLQWQ